MNFLKALASVFLGWKPARHYVRDAVPGHGLVCHCGYHSPWDYDLRKHFEQMGRIGK